MKAKLKFNGKEVVIEDMIRASGLKKFTGLMFKDKEAKALLFEYKGVIHSFFCKPFLAIWLNQGKIVDYKLVQPNQLSVKLEKEFDSLIEIPFNNKYADVINFFIDDGKV